MLPVLPRSYLRLSPFYKHRPNAISKAIAMKAVRRWLIEQLELYFVDDRFQSSATFARELQKIEPVAGELLFRPSFLRISLPCYDSAMGNLLVLFTIERVRHDQALHDSSHACKLLIVKEMVGASGFEPPSSWSRTKNSKILSRFGGVA